MDTCAEISASSAENFNSNNSDREVLDPAIIPSDVASGWKVEKVVASVDREEGRFYKIKLVRYIWESEENLQRTCSSHLVNEYWIACANRDTRCSSGSPDLSNINPKDPAASFTECETTPMLQKHSEICNTSSTFTSYVPLSAGELCSSTEDHNEKTDGTCEIEMAHPNTADMLTAGKDCTDLSAMSAVTIVKNHHDNGKESAATELQLDMSMSENIDNKVCQYDATNDIIKEDNFVNVNVLNLAQSSEYGGRTHDVCKSDKNEAILSPVINFCNSDDNKHISSPILHGNFNQSEKDVTENAQSVINVCDSDANLKTMPYNEEKRFKCMLCMKSFNRKTSLQRHSLIHTGEKPFHCKYCSKSFNQNAMLQRHVLIHVNYKPFFCDICNKTFAEKGALNRHIPTHAGRKSFKCHECGKAFILKEYLAKHLFLHSGKKPYSCDKCEHTFADSSAFKRHQKIHDRCDSDYICTICKKQHKKNSALKKHEKHCNSASNTVLFHCTICKLRFNSKALLTMHQKSHPMLLK